LLLASALFLIANRYSLLDDHQGVNTYSALQLSH